MPDEFSGKVPKAQRGQVISSPVTYGTSVLGMPLEVFMPTGIEHPVLIMAAHHGDEPETTALLSAALRSIPAALLKCAVILAANPDGLARGTRGNARGVDLNRNFPTQNWQSDPVLHCWYDDEPKSVELSTGKAPGSEPETQALLELIRSISPKAVISLHSRLACVDDPDTTLLGQWLAQETALPLVPNIGYPTPGSFGTWAAENVLPLITFELPDKSIITLRRTLCSVFETLLLQPDEILTSMATS
ncbi:MAG: murein tripeptide amidase MpaA [Pseudomonadota bacterium]